MNIHDWKNVTVWSGMPLAAPETPPADQKRHRLTRNTAGCTGTLSAAQEHCRLHRNTTGCTGTPPADHEHRRLQTALTPTVVQTRSVYEWLTPTGVKIVTECPSLPSTQQLLQLNHQIFRRHLPGRNVLLLTLRMTHKILKHVRITCHSMSLNVLDLVPKSNCSAFRKNSSALWHHCERVSAVSRNS